MDKLKRNKHHVVPAVLLVPAIALGTTFAYQGEAASGSRTGFVTASASEVAIDRSVDAYGQVEPASEATLSFQASGRVNWVGVKEGARVKAGQTLATLDTRQLSASVAGAAAGVKLAQAKLAQVEEGARPEDLTVSENGVQSAQAALGSAQTAVQNAQTALATAQVSADASSHAAALSLHNAIVASEVAMDDGLRNGMQPFFGGSPHSYSLSYGVNDPELVTDVLARRDALDSELASFSSELAALGDDPDGATLSAYVPKAIAHLNALSDLCVRLSDSLANDPSQNGTVLSAAAIAADRTILDGVRAGMVADASALRSGADQVSRTEVGNAATLQAARSGLASAQAAADQAESGVGIAQSQSALKAAPARSTDLDMAKAQLAAAQAAYAAAAAMLSNARIVSPISGTVATVSIDPGEAANPGQPAIVVYPDGDEVDVYLNELEVSRVGVGSPASLTFDALSGAGKVAGSVSAVDYASTASQGSAGRFYKVAVVPDSAVAGLKPGMSANVLLSDASGAKALAVPAAAVVKQDGLDYVLLPAHDGTLVRKQVTLGVEGTATPEGGTATDVVEVRSGLSAGDTVVLYPNPERA